MTATRAAEQAARESYGKLMACLGTRWRDWAAIEDALGDAFRAALETWPASGVPREPAAWLLTAARRRLIDAARQSRTRAELIAEVEARMSHRQPDFPDERLQMLFICAHPALEPGVRTALMLQSVLGLDAATIARAFLVSPAAMSQRLVRAKAWIRDTGLRFGMPEPREFPGRLHSVLEAIYAAFNTGWEGQPDEAFGPAAALAEESIWLARVLVDVLPDEPEPLGLLALLLFCDSRREARLDAAGEYVRLPDQDASRWSADMIAEAEQLLWRASRFRRPGPFQLEAAIQSAHAERGRTGVTNWAAIANLYRGLLELAPTIGAQIAYAAALAEVEGAAAGLAYLDTVPASSYQPYWAVRADLLLRLGRAREALDCYREAILRTRVPSVRRFLENRSRLCGGPAGQSPS